MKVLCLDIALIILFAFPAYATDFYYRPACESDGDGTGSTCGSGAGYAWNAMDNTKWDSMGGGDTLYLIGTHSGTFNIMNGGSDPNYLTIRGDHAAGAGTITGTVVFYESSAVWVKLYELTINGQIGRGISTALGDGSCWSATFEGSDTEGRVYERDDTTTWAAKGWVAGNCFTSTHDQGVWLINSVSSGNPADDTYLVINETGDNSDMEDFGPGTYTAYRYFDLHHIWIENCNIQATAHNQIGLEVIAGDDLTLKNNEFDGNDYYITGIFYTTGLHHYEHYDNITIEGNYIHNIKGTSGQAEGHGIGIQSGKNLTITKNYFKNCVCGVVLWVDQYREVTDWEITYNKIENMDSEGHMNEWPGCGIVLSGNGLGKDTSNGVIAYNLIIDPINTPDSKFTDEIAIARNDSWKSEVKIYNNTIINYWQGLNAYASPGTNYVGKVYNNIVAWTGTPQSGTVMIAVDDDDYDYYEDYMLYYPEGSYYDSSMLSFDTWIEYCFPSSSCVANNDPIDCCTGSGTGTCGGHKVRAVNENSYGFDYGTSLVDPDLNADYTLKSTSPAIDAGKDLGITYQNGLDPDSVWPTAKGGGSITTLDQDNYGFGWEIGAFVYESLQTVLENIRIEGNLN